MSSSAEVWSTKSGDAVGRLYVWFFKTFGLFLSQRMYMYRQFESFLAKNLTVDRVLNDSVAVYEENGVMLRHVYRHLLKQPDKHLHENLAGFCPATELMLLESGQKQGKPEIGMRAALRLCEANARLVKALLGLVIGSGSLILGGVFGIYFLSTSLSDVVKVFENKPGFVMPDVSRSFLAFGQFMETYGLLCIVAVIIAGCFVVYSLPRWIGVSGDDRPGRLLRSFLDQFVPPYTLYRNFQSSALMTALAALLSASKTIGDSLETILVRSNPWMSNHCRAMLMTLRSGEINVGAVLTVSGLLRGNALYSLLIIGRSGSVIAVIQPLADEILENTLQVFDRFTKVAATVSMLSVAGMVMWMVGAMQAINMAIAQMGK